MICENSDIESNNQALVNVFCHGPKIYSFLTKSANYELILKILSKSNHNFSCRQTNKCMN